MIYLKDFVIFIHPANFFNKIIFDRIYINILCQLLWLCKKFKPEIPIDPTPRLMNPGQSRDLKSFW